MKTLMNTSKSKIERALKAASSRGAAVAALLAAVAAASTGCMFSSEGGAQAPNLLPGGSAAQGVTSIGGSLNPANIPGVGSMSVPTAASVVARIQRTAPAGASGTDYSLGAALAASSKSCYGNGSNCASALSTMLSNLPSTSSPLSATGQDQIPVLVYAACSDISSTVMSTTYGVTGNTLNAATQSALVTAGVNMVNTHVAGLAASGSSDPAIQATNAQVQQIFTNLVNADVATAGITVKMAFVSVCLAANTFGIGMTGF